MNETKNPKSEPTTTSADNLPFVEQLSKDERQALRIAEDRRKRAPEIEAMVEPALSPMDEQVMLARKDGLIPSDWQPFWGKVLEPMDAKKYLAAGYVPVKRPGSGEIRVEEMVLYIQPVEVARARERASGNLSRARLAGCFPSDKDSRALHEDPPSQSSKRFDAQKCMA